VRWDIASNRRNPSPVSQMTSWKPPAISDPRFGFAAVLEIEDLHKRASDRSSAFLFDHVHEKVKLAALGNEDAKTVKIAHIVSLMRGRAPLFLSEANSMRGQFCPRPREPQFIPLRKSDKLDRRR
jgi:hypothetical protein